MTLKPGDVILTGTPPGVGCFKKPPVYLKVGITYLHSMQSSAHHNLAACKNNLKLLNNLLCLVTTMMSGLATVVLNSVDRP